jgi:hypothetical protein
MPADGLSAGYVCPPLPPEELGRSRRRDKFDILVVGAR